MSRYTAKIKDWCKSNSDIYYTKPLESGGYFKPHEISKSVYKKFWSNCNLNVDIDDNFKLEFMDYFYDREIGQETWEAFFLRLSSTINVDCNQEFKVLSLLNKLSDDDIFKSVELTNKYTNVAINAAKALVGELHLSGRTPETEQNIIYDINNLDVGANPGEKDLRLIKVPSEINENYAKNTSDNQGIQDGERKTTGFQGGSKFEKLIALGMMPEIKKRIFNTINSECFFLLCEW